MSKRLNRPLTFAHSHLVAEQCPEEYADHAPSSETHSCRTCFVGLIFLRFFSSRPGLPRSDSREVAPVAEPFGRADCAIRAPNCQRFLRPTDAERFSGTFPKPFKFNQFLNSFHSTLSATVFIDRMLRFTEVTRAD